MAYGQDAGGRGGIVDNIPPADTTTAYSQSLFGQVFKVFQRTRSCLSLELWIKTRGASDSLTITVQTSNSLSDTLGWVNFTNFGGIKTATGHSYLQKCNDYWIVGDSTRFFGTYVRLISQHGATADSSLPADTSRFSVRWFETGTQIRIE